MSKIFENIEHTGEGLPPHVDPSDWHFQRLKVDVHQRLIETFDLSDIQHADRSVLERQIRAEAADACAMLNEPLSRMERERLVADVVAEVFGLGPLEEILSDPSVSDILVNGPYTVYVERRGRLELTDIVFADTDHLTRIIQRIVSRIGRRIDEVSPMVDARLEDGSRINAVIPPVALRGPKLSIRRFGVDPLTIDDLLANESMVPEMVDFLNAVMQARIGLVISGGTGSGKTTLLNAVSSFIPDDERIVSIEDSAELQLKHAHWVQMECRPENIEGTGEVSQRDLVRNSLRMRPDRIIVGEVRGSEVWDMLQAMNTGHEGSLTTVHANSAQDALCRLEMMAAMTGFELPVSVVRQYICAGVKLLVHTARLRGGARKVTQITEIVGVDSDFILRDIFRYQQTDVSEDGVAQGHYLMTGHEPTFLDRMSTCGIRFRDGFFQAREMGLVAPERELATPAPTYAESKK